MNKNQYLKTLMISFFVVSSVNAQTFEWNTLGSGDKNDLFSESNYIDVSTGLMPPANTINGNAEINFNICIRGGKAEDIQSVGSNLKLGTGSLIVENSTLKLKTDDKAGIDLGSGNTTFTINNSEVTAEFVNNATIIMEGRSKLILTGDINCLNNSTIELRSPDAFVDFVNLRPSQVTSPLISKIRSNSENAEIGLRLSEYFLGSNLRALPKNKNQADYLGSFSDGFYGKIGINSGLTYDGLNNYSIVGFGNDIGGNEDMFHFGYKTLSGDGVIIALCNSVQANNTTTKAGIMIRSSLDFDAPFVMALMNPDSTVYSMYRERKGAASMILGNVTGATKTAKYLKLVRVGNEFSSFYSEDGTSGSWIQLGITKTIEMGDSVYFGLARSSAQGTLGASALFSNVSIQQNEVSVSDSLFGVFDNHIDVLKPCPFEDQISSILLKKGFELCMSSDGAGQGYSQVWVADKEDMFINLPDELSMKNSFFRIVPWRWVSKKGMAGEGVKKVLAGTFWNYEWEPSGESTSDIEFVPMIKGRVQNKNYRWEEVRVRDGQTHMLGFNEPMSDKQGDLTVDEAIALWPKEQMMGLRLGSPARTDGDIGDKWLIEFMQKAKDKGYRIDFVNIHCYNKNNAPAMRSWINAEYQKYGKPIWLSEFNCDQFTTVAAQEKYVAEVVKMLEDAPFVERYAYYNDKDTRNLFNATFTGLSTVGQVYYNQKSNPAFTSPPYDKWLVSNLTVNNSGNLTASVSNSVSNDVIQSVEYFVNGVSSGVVSSAPFGLESIHSNDVLLTVRADVKTIFGEVQSTNSVQLYNNSTGFNNVRDSKFNVYPNPCKEVLNLSDYLNWQLYNMDGLKIKEGFGNSLNTSPLKNGLYFIKARNSFSKFIKF
ncbi:MAG: glycosyl hydrolase [Bacteroidia bacterium]|nr:glycosyl hydrolase [Bacteroidia bacterium]